MIIFNLFKLPPMVTISVTGGKRICSYMRQTCGFHGFKDILGDFPRGTVDRNLPANVGDMGLIPGLGRFHNKKETKAIVTMLKNYPYLLNECMRAFNKS